MITNENKETEFLGNRDALGYKQILSKQSNGRFTVKMVKIFTEVQSSTTNTKNDIS